MIFALYVYSAAYAVTLESTVYPIQVIAPDEALATAAMSASEDAWRATVIELGFAPPLMRDAAGDAVEGFAISFVSQGEDQLATFNILGDIPETPASDCPTRGVVNANHMDEPGWLEMTVVHLLNHASLHAVDCLEPQMPSFDFFTVAVEHLLGVDAFGPWYYREFQSHPEASLDAVYSDRDHAHYQFGSSLFPLFLTERYGDGSGALLADIWARTPQDGHILFANGELPMGDVENEPDYLDAIQDELAARGSSLDQAMIAFTEWRFFTGEFNDGEHFADAATLPEVFVDGQVTAAAFPLEVTPTRPLAEYASSYVLVDVAAHSDPLTLSFAGGEGIAWGASVYVLDEGGAHIGDHHLALDGGAGSIDLEPAEGPQTLVLACTALTDGSHDPEDSDWDQEHTYQWSLDEAPLDDDQCLEPHGSCMGSSKPSGLFGLMLPLGLVVWPRRSRVLERGAPIR
ncbi:MAG: hypothetical protein JXX28_13500 [Deltaproteobacteria bacterium]|nr:hypothetical protein [Deltaproteobacteria bacterium]